MTTVLEKQTPIAKEVPTTPAAPVAKNSFLFMRWVAFRVWLNERLWLARMWMGARLLDKWHIRIWKEGRLSLGEGHGKVLDALRKDGVARIPGYFSEDELSVIEKVCHTALREAEGQPDRIDLARLPGSIRLRHLDERFPLLQRMVARDAFLLLIGWIFHGRPIWPSVMYQITHDGSFQDPAVPGKAQTTFGGKPHFDQWFHQIKGVLLLSDVTSKNGPLAFLQGSSHIHPALLETCAIKYRQHKKTKTDYADDNIPESYAQQVMNKYSLKYGTGNRGDLVLFDTRTLHLASRLEEGARRVLWVYF